MKAYTDVTQFLAECCEQAPGLKEDKVRMWEAYLDWCMQRAFPASRAEAFLEGLSSAGLPIVDGYINGVKLSTAPRARLARRGRKE